ncbi:transcriptional regulator [Saccharospirillum sp. MSK14-1]|uniref:LysR family transcriptional regulator n=1 Tax=Saccharospirillum sp. MSK14-1 TaxID=1897632 RepID=UPI000D39B440|nr:LysR family transcriptional regulator [Saccharospirillum sp. MSK14-1]PTY37368.1 transcriptional regulator [Saccharospirillum sp. MSK14-1]
MIEKLELKQVRTLAVLLQTGSISATAEHLSLSQQAVSQQLNRLRELLGDPLFVRSGQGMAPTHYARSIEAQLQHVLAAVQAIPLPGQQALNELDRALVISATDYTQQLIALPLLAELREWAPNVRLKLINIEAQSLTRRMQQGDIDLALTTSAYVPEGLESRALFTEEYRLYSAHHSVPDNTALSLSQLVGLDFVVTSPGTADFKGSAQDWFERRDIKRRVVLSVPSFYMAQRALQQAALVAFLPRRLPRLEGIYELPLQPLPPGYEVVAAYHPSAASDPLLRRVLTWMQTYF